MVLKRWGRIRRSSLENQKNISGERERERGMEVELNVFWGNNKILKAKFCQKIHIHVVIVCLKNGIIWIFISSYHEKIKVAWLIWMCHANHIHIFQGNLIEILQMYKLSITYQKGKLIIVIECISMSYNHYSTQNSNYKTTTHAQSFKCIKEVV